MLDLREREREREGKGARVSSSNRQERRRGRLIWFYCEQYYDTLEHTIIILDATRMSIKHQPVFVWDQLPPTATAAFEKNFIAAVAA